MTREQASKVQPGDIIAHELGGQAVVLSNTAGRIVAVRTFTLTSVSEWKVLRTHSPTAAGLAETEGTGQSH